MSYISAVLASNPVGFWELGEASGTTAVDAAANSNGAYSATGITLGQPGPAGMDSATGARFTAAGSGLVNIPDVAAQHVLDTFSLELWLKMNTLGVEYALFGALNVNAPYMRIEPSGQINILKDSAVNIGLSTAAITDTTLWHHVMWTKAAAVNRLYVDGADATGTMTNATMVNATGYSIGSERLGAPFPNAMMAMVALYPTALSSSVATSHWQIGSAAAGASTLELDAPVLHGQFI